MSFRSLPFAILASIKFENECVPKGCDYLLIAETCESLSAFLLILRVDGRKRMPTDRCSRAFVRAGLICAEVARMIGTPLANAQHSWSTANPALFGSSR